MHIQLTPAEYFGHMFVQPIHLMLGWIDNLFLFLVKYLEHILFL